MMDAQRWRQVRELFEQLVDAPPESWESRLAAACDDAQTCAEALALLRADTGALTQREAAQQVPALLEAASLHHERVQSARLIGQRLGPFELLREVGRGGMGQVWLARRVDGQFEQEVAVKLLRQGWEDAPALARFRAERQILAGLTHPNIAHLIDGGVDESGRPWLALEYVDGSNLLAHCDTRRLDLNRRLAIFLTVCSAVAHAHAQLVVHRDLKPSNLLVDAAGQVKLLDFGIAKLIEADAASTATRIFTPEYAAPEQLRGEAVTTAVDVYALGLLLYELLTGRLPYKLENSTPAAYERAILEQEPTRPSVAVTHGDPHADAEALAAQRELTPQGLRRELRGDLDAIVLKALRKEPAQRYASVGEFAADIRRYLERRPVVARRGNWRYHATRFLQRHALATALVALAAASLVGGLGVALWQTRVARAERDNAAVQAQSARRIAAFLQGVFEDANPDNRPGETFTARQLLAEGARAIRGDLKAQPEVRAALMETLGRAQLALDDPDAGQSLLDEAVQLRAAGSDRNAEALARIALARSLMRLRRDKEAEAQLVLARDGVDVSQRSGVEAHIAALAALATLLINTDKQEQAIDALRQVMGRQQALYGADDARVLNTLMQLSYVLTWQHRAQEAFELIDPQWQRIAARSKPGDVQRRTLLDAEINALRMSGRNAEAIPLAQEDLAMQERVYGRTHDNYHVAQRRLALILYQLDRAAEAVPLLAEVVAALPATGEKREKIAPYILRDYARALDAAGRHIDALPMFERSLQIWRAGQPPDPGMQANVLVGLARAERRAGRFDAAARHLDEGLHLPAPLPNYAWEVSALKLEQVRLDLDQGKKPEDCTNAETATHMRKDSGKAGKLAEAQAVLVACRIVAGRRDLADGSIAGLVAARKTQSLSPPEAEALDYALQLWHSGAGAH